VVLGGVVLGSGGVGWFRQNKAPKSKIFASGGGKGVQKRWRQKI